MTYLMVDKSIIVNMLTLVTYHTTISKTFCSLALENKVETIASNAIMQSYHIMVYHAISLLLNINIAHASVLIVSFLQAIEVELSIFANESLYNLSSKEVAVVGSMVAEQELSFRALLHNDKHTAVYHKVHIRAEDVYHLYSLFYLHILRYIHHQTILRQHGVKGSNSIVASIGNLAIILSNKLRMLCGNLRQRANDNAFSKRAFWQHLIVEAVVDYEI